MFFVDADPNGMGGLAGINSEPTDLPQVGANQPPMPGASDGVALPALMPEGYGNIVLPPEQPIDYGGAPAEIPLGAVLSAAPLTGSGDASDRFAVLSDALALGYEQLKQFAGSPDLLTQMGLAFGNGFNAEVAGYLVDNWSNGIISGPPIEVVSATEIDWADAAFAGATKTIYISEELLARSSENAGTVANAWLEEYGHYVDSLVNVTDAPGDEGAIFSAVVRGESLSQERLNALRVESDRAFVVIDGMEVEIEKAISPALSSFLEGNWVAKYGYRDAEGELKRVTTESESGKTNSLFKSVSNAGSQFQSNWAPWGSPSLVPTDDYFAAVFYTIANFEEGQVYNFTVEADDRYRISAFPLERVSDGYDGASGGQWEYISEYDVNSEDQKINTWREDAYDPITLEFAPDMSGPYLIRLNYVEKEEVSKLSVSWQGNSIVGGTGSDIVGGQQSDDLSDRVSSVSNGGLSFIGDHEGTILDLYNDPGGHCTIGVGHLVHTGPCDGSEPTEFRNGITEQRAIEILRNDADEAVRAVKDLVTVPLNQHQFDALVSFAFNVGREQFRTSDLLQRLNEGEYNAVPSELSRWVHSGGVKLPGLVRRREEEGKLFAEGIYS